MVISFQSLFYHHISCCYWGFLWTENCLAFIRLPSLTCPTSVNKSQLLKIKHRSTRLLLLLPWFVPLSAVKGKVMLALGNPLALRKTQQLWMEGNRGWWDWKRDVRIWKMYRITNSTVKDLTDSAGPWLNLSNVSFFLPGLSLSCTIHSFKTTSVQN